MRLFVSGLGLVVLAALLSGCGRGAAPPAPTPSAGQLVEKGLADLESPNAWTRMEAAKRYASSFARLMDGGPTPNSETLLAQKNWSAICGMTKAGFPARNPAEVVPNPP